MAGRTILCAPDSFKGTLTAAEAATAISTGVRTVWPDAHLREIPLADGGEGSLAVLHAAAGGDLRSVLVEDPLGRPVSAVYLVLPEVTAVVEMAQASGLTLIPPAQRDAERASTFGTGQLIRAAVEAGARRLIVCLGGSATSDGGAGMAEALGFRLLDEGGRPLPRGGSGLANLSTIDRTGVNPRLKDVSFVAATDVTNPLCGPDGAAAVYGPQKGADADAVRRLEAGLRRLGAVLESEMGTRVLDLPGAGAAGGLGAGLVGFLGAQIESGAEVLMDAAGIPAALQEAALCFTGEGRIDGQSSQGKLISRLAARCRNAGVPLIAIGGSVVEDADRLLALGVTALVSSTVQPGPAPANGEEAAARLSTAATNACRVLAIGVGMEAEGVTAQGRLAR